MESSSFTFTAKSQLPVLCSKPLRYRGEGGYYPLKKKTRPSYRLSICNCQKMYVPGFGEASPEAKAANNLHNFFTYVAVRIVAAQLESYNEEAHRDILEFMNNHSLNDGDKFLAQLMRESPAHQNLALRILEVRTAYCKNDFEWDNLKRLAIKMVGERNTKLMKDYVTETTTKAEKEK